MRALSAWTAALLAGLLVAGLPAGAGADAPDAALQGEGRVVAIDEVLGAITVEHGPISGVAATTRSEFPVERPEWLQRLRIGDRVVFRLAPEAGSQGILTITDLTVRPGARPLAGLLGLRPGEAAAAAVALAGLVVGAFVLRELRRLHRLLQRHDTALATIARAQQALRRETEASLAETSRALHELARWISTETRRLTDRVQLARGAAPPEGDTAAARPAVPLVVVSRGEPDTFQSMQERLGRAGSASVILDRRMVERRAGQGAVATERRRRERRAPPPVTWSNLGYLVVEPRRRRLTIVA